MDRPEGYVTTHVLDTALGQPAAGLAVDVFKLSDASAHQRSQLASLITNTDGRTDQPVIAVEDMAVGHYELVFRAGGYLAGSHGRSTGVHFLDVIPIRFGISDPTQHYHVPLLLSPFGYSTYRGS